jgi:hypothetical protein
VIDGDDFGIIEPGQELVVSTSDYPMPCIVHPLGVPSPADMNMYSNEWVKDVNDMLKFNSTFAGKRLLEEDEYKD